MWLVKNYITRISDLHTEYMETKLDLASSTRQITKEALSDLIDSVGNKRIFRFSLADAEKFRSHILNTGKNKVTANMYCKTIRPMFRWAVRNKRIKDDPFKNLRLLKIPKKEVRILEPEEIGRLLKACPSVLWKARIALAVTAALRRGEVLNLTIGDVDFNSMVINIREKKDGLYVWRWIPKDKDSRPLPLTDYAARLLTEVMLKLPEKQPYLLLTKEQYRRVLDRHQQKTLTDTTRNRPHQNFNREFNKITTKAGVRCTFHNLRATCITQWLEAGLQPHEAKELAGHASIETTMKHYVATRQNLLDKARNITKNRGDRT